MGAITIEEREAEPYDERKVMENIVPQGEKVIRAHLEHLAEHNESEYLKEATAYLKEIGLDIEIGQEEPARALHHHSSCPGAQVREFIPREEAAGTTIAKTDGVKGSKPSQLRQWPVQLHLIPPSAPYFKDSDLLLSTDCVAYASGDFHKDYLRGKTLAIACPKLDSNHKIYLDRCSSRKEN